MGAIVALPGIIAEPVQANQDSSVCHYGAAQFRGNSGRMIQDSHWIIIHPDSSSWPAHLGDANDSTPVGDNHEGHSGWTTKWEGDSFDSLIPRQISMDSCLARNDSAPRDSGS